MKFLVFSALTLEIYFLVPLDVHINASVVYSARNSTCVIYVRERVSTLRSQQASEHAYKHTIVRIQCVPFESPYEFALDDFANTSTVLMAVYFDEGF